MANNNGWKGVLWKVVGVVAAFLVVGVLSTGWQLYHDVTEIKRDVDSLKVSMAAVGHQVGEMHARMSNEGWEGYSAWQWELEMHRIYCQKLGLEPGEYPEPPQFLRERPGYNGP